MDFKRRLSKIKQKLKKNQVDALLVCNFYNLYYLSGFSGLSKEEREGWLFITKKESYFFTDGRYKKETIEGFPYKIKIISSAKEVFCFIEKYCQLNNLKMFAIESDDLRVNEYFFIINNLRNVKVRPVSSLIMEERMIKDKDDIKKIKKAC